MTANTRALDRWIRHDFVSINTELENLYFDQSDRANTQNIGESLKRRLLDEGNDLIKALLAEGNTDEGFEAGFDLLGNVGFFMAACRRHDLTEPSREQVSPLTDASALAMQIGASIGMIPRFSTAHLTTHNLARNGIAKSFTSLSDEAIFNEYNTRSILAYQRAADALVRIVKVGASAPVAVDLLHNAAQALRDVCVSNGSLNDKLDVDRFFYSVRPYYKSYRVGRQVYRGANAGDFAGINIIDLLLGVCRADDAYYSQLLVDKMLYMMPSEQALLRDVMRMPSILSALIDGLDGGQENSVWLKSVTSAFLSAFEAHAETARQHHNLLVERFITQPSESLKAQHHERLTASGPPLPVLLAALEKLRDLRCAVARDDVKTAAQDIAKLRAFNG